MHMEVVSQLRRHILPITDLKCTVGCPILDDFLRGGIPCGMITEIAGNLHACKFLLFKHAMVFLHQQIFHLGPALGKCRRVNSVQDSILSAAAPQCSVAKGSRRFGRIRTVCAVTQLLGCHSHNNKKIPACLREQLCHFSFQACLCLQVHLHRGGATHEETARVGCPPATAVRPVAKSLMYSNVAKKPWRLTRLLTPSAGIAAAVMHSRTFSWSET